MSKQEFTELNYERIGKRIRYVRRLHDMSQEELVAATNISTSHISNIENANTKLSLDALVRIAQALQVTPNELLSSEFSNQSDTRTKLVAQILADCTEDEFADCLKLLELFMKSVKKHNTG